LELSKRKLSQVNVGHIASLRGRVKSYARRLSMSWIMAI
jgi:hypothetical protein